MISKNNQLRMNGRVALIILPIIAIISIVILLYVGFCVKQLDNHIYPNVYIDNLNVGTKTQKQIVDFFSAKNQKLQNVLFEVVYKDSPIATFSGTQLNLRYNGQNMAEQAYGIGRSAIKSRQIYQQAVSFFGLHHFQFFSSIEFDKTPINEMISYNEDKYNLPAKNALFKFEKGKVINFRPDEKGLQIESKKLIQSFNAAIQELNNKVENKNLILTDHIIEPEITLVHSNNYGVEGLIAEGRSDYSHSIPERIHNIILASSKLNGILIPKDKTFSFNDTIGDISSLTGYQPAYIIKDGKTVLGDGGGVCQVSTTLFRAALNAGLPITQRIAHAYRVGYYENDSKPGFDATVFAPYVDLQFKNDTQAYILIQTEIDKERNLLYFKFYGKKDNRKITISPVTISDVQPPPPPVFQDDPTLKKGVVKQIDFAAWGSKAYFTYTVTKEGQSPVTQSFFSVYKPWQAIYLNGTAD